MFKISQGISPHHYLTEVRLEKARHMIKKEIPLAQVALQCGFSHQSHFNNVFRKEIGLSPGEYIKVNSTT